MARVNNPRVSKGISFHPTILRWLTELARDEYEGNLSAAVTALVLYNRGVTRAKALAGQKHSHHLTRGVPQDPSRLESVISEIDGLDPGFNARTWLELEKERNEPQ